MTPRPEHVLCNFRNFDMVVWDVIHSLRKVPPKYQAEFFHCEKKNLVQFHHTMGREIRNRHAFYTQPWEPEIEYGIDVSPFHPDAISMAIITEVWLSAGRNFPGLERYENEFSYRVIDNSQKPELKFCFFPQRCYSTNEAIWLGKGYELSYQHNIGRSTRWFTATELTRLKLIR